MEEANKKTVSVYVNLGCLGVANCVLSPLPPPRSSLILVLIPVLIPWSQILISIAADEQDPEGEKSDSFLLISHPHNLDFFDYFTYPRHDKDNFVKLKQF